jgi:hypothetical protein
MMVAPPPPPTPQPATSSTPTQPTGVAKITGGSTPTSVVVYHGALKMEMDEAGIPKTVDRIIDMAEALGGQLVKREDKNVTIKVPSASFRDALARIDALGVVTKRSVNADDVTEEFRDLEVRLTNLRATRARLQQFLAKAAAMNDMLAVERELERVSQEIDRIEGRLEFLRSRAAMSAIDVELTAKPKDAPIAARANGPRAPVGWVADLGAAGLLSLHH